ncbi:MAG: hypothetical protein ABI162_16740 [Luteolibacter sp.]
MKSIPAILLIASIPFCPCCADLKPKKADAKKEETPKAKPPEAPKLVGKIASIPADKRFVLIQSYGKWEVDTGSILTTRGTDDRSANLLATGESLGEFAAADIQSGKVEVGDAVYSRHLPKPASLSITPESSENQPKADSGNVQKNN